MILIYHLQPFTHKFPRADIHELLTPDLLHQVIKGTFKDHLVTWVTEYLYEEHGETGANAILGDIDRRYMFLSGFLYDPRFCSLSSQEYLLYLPFQDYDASRMGVTLRSGLVTTRKRL